MISVLVGGKSNQRAMQKRAERGDEDKMRSSGKSKERREELAWSYASNLHALLRNQRR